MAVTGAERRKRRATPEQDFQAALVKVLRLALHPRRAIVFAVPNGGARTRTEAAILKGQGVVPGIPDLLVLWTGGRGAGLECKDPNGGSTSAAQLSIHRQFGDLGFPVAVVRSASQALDFLREQGAPLRVVGGA